MITHAANHTDDDFVFRDLIERLPVAVYTAALDEASTTLYVSPQSASVIGIEAETLVREPAAWFEAIHDSDRDRVSTALRALQVEGTPLCIEYRIRGHDGRDRWVRDEATLMRDELGLPHCIQGVLLDVSEQRAAECALRMQKDVLQRILDALPMMVNLIAPGGEITYANRAMEDTLGWTAEELRAGVPLSELYPDAGERERAVRSMASNSGEFTEFRTRRRDGRIISTLWANSALPDGRSIGVGKDVTDRKRLEEELRHAA